MTGARQISKTIQTKLMLQTSIQEPFSVGLSVYKKVMNGVKLGFAFNAGKFFSNNKKKNKKSNNQTEQ
jgi:hypothetical protein